MSLKSTSKSTKSGRKTAPSVICYKCKKSVHTKNALLCTVCKNSYEFDCAGFSEKLYMLLTQESKDKWKCKLCIKGLSNITTRKKISSTKKLTGQQLVSTDIVDEASQSCTPQTSQISDPLYSPILTENTPDVSISSNKSATREKFDKDSNTSTREQLDLDYNTSVSSEDTKLSISSLPALRSHDNEENNDLKMEIKTLLSQLESAHNQIDELVLENGFFKKKLAEQELKIKQLTQIASSSSSKKKTEKAKSSKKKGGSSNKELYLNKSLNDSELINIADHTTLTNNGTQKLESTTQTEDDKLNHDEKKENSYRNPENPDKKIWIVGGQSCAGLAACLTDLRKNSNYEQYTVSAMTKPQATTDEILKGFANYPIGKMDKVIIGVGENDTNPILVSSELYSILKILQNNDVIVLNALCNEYLNENMLNRQIQLICNNFPNCKFIYTPNHVIHKSQIMMTCTQLNLAIDSIDYENKYLKFKKYIKNANKNTRILVNTKRNMLELDGQQDKPKKGTIPYYFPIVGKNLNASATITAPNRDKSFFRQ